MIWLNNGNSTVSGTVMDAQGNFVELPEGFEIELSEDAYERQATITLTTPGPDPLTIRLTVSSS